MRDLTWGERSRGAMSILYKPVCVEWVRWKTEMDEWVKGGYPYIIGSNKELSGMRSQTKLLNSVIRPHHGLTPDLDNA